MIDLFISNENLLIFVVRNYIHPCYHYCAITHRIIVDYNVIIQTRFRSYKYNEKIMKYLMQVNYNYNGIIKFTFTRVVSSRINIFLPYYNLTFNVTRLSTFAQRFLKLKSK